MSRLRRAEVVLPAAIVLAALVLAASEFMVTFELSPPGGDPLSEQVANDRHGWAMLVLAVFAIASTVVAIATGQRIAAFATAGFGVAALILFLVIDLPDVGQLGDVEAPAFGLATAEAVPQAGFWLGAISAVVLGLAGIAFATLSSEQLEAPKRLLDRRRSGKEPKPAERTPA